jgi:hypothetical protein
MLPQIPRNTAVQQQAIDRVTESGNQTFLLPDDLFSIVSKKIALQERKKRCRMPGCEDESFTGN